MDENSENIVTIRMKLAMQVTTRAFRRDGVPDERQALRSDGGRVHV
jgi:hypothetical protein